jgi:hypothetical protein
MEKRAIFLQKKRNSRGAFSIEKTQFPARAAHDVRDGQRAAAAKPSSGFQGVLMAVSKGFSIMFGFFRAGRKVYVPHYMFQRSPNATDVRAIFVELHPNWQGLKV